MRMRAWIGTALVALTLLAAHIVFDGVFSALRGRTFDLYQTIYPSPPVSSPVILVAIDERSLSTTGRWPWNRGRIAELVDAVAANGATAIGLDVLFPEPDTGPGGPEGDQQLARSLAAAPSVLAASIEALPTAAAAEPKAGWSLVGEVPQELPAFGGLVTSRAIFNDAAHGIGIIRATPDSDGTLRQLPLVWLRDGAGGLQLWPSFALELVRTHMGETGFAVRMANGGFDALRIGPRTIPLETSGTVNLRERYGSLPLVSAQTLLDGSADPRIRGAIAIVTVSAAGIDQHHITPAQVARLGAEVHGLVIEQLLTGDFPRHVADAKWIERAWFLAGTALVIILGSMVVSRPWLSVPAMILVVASPLAAGIAIFMASNSLVEGLQPAAGLLLAAVTSGYSNYRLAEQRRQVLIRQFSQFLSPAIVGKLAESDAEAMIAVEKREVTVLMMDIRGFTTMTHTLSASEIVAIVNHFLAIATDEILKRDGTIDKFIGDAVLAIWNAPIAVADHADRALAAALAIIDRVAASNGELTAKGLPSLRVGAGLETGICSVGNYGTVRRIDYTAIGDSVNLAARLEGATKAVGAALLAGSGTAAAVSSPMRSLGKVKIHGFDEEIEVFTTARREG